MNKNQLIEQLTSNIATIAGYQRSDIPSDLTFDDIGLGSMQLLELTQMTAMQLDIELDETTCFEHPSIDHLAAFLEAKVRNV